MITGLICIALLALFAVAICGIFWWDHQHEHPGPVEVHHDEYRTSPGTGDAGNCPPAFLVPATTPAAVPGDGRHSGGLTHAGTPQTSPARTRREGPHPSHAPVSPTRPDTQLTAENLPSRPGTTTPALAPLSARDDGEGEGRAFHGLNHADRFGLPIRGDAQGRDVRVRATESRPAARADLTGSLSPRPPQEGVRGTCAPPPALADDDPESLYPDWPTGAFAAAIAALDDGGA